MREDGGKREVEEARGGRRDNVSDGEALEERVLSEGWGSRREK